jgi:hypothetical protein
MFCYDVLRYPKETTIRVLGYQQSYIDDQDILSTVSITTIARNPVNLKRSCGLRLTTKITRRVPDDGPSSTTGEEEKQK